MLRSDFLHLLSEMGNDLAGQGEFTQAAERWSQALEQLPAHQAAVVDQGGPGPGPALLHTHRWQGEHLARRPNERLRPPLLDGRGLVRHDLLVGTAHHATVGCRKFLTDKGIRQSLEQPNTASG